MYNLRCHHCTQWVGESSQPLEFAGMVKRPPDRVIIDPPRVSYRCGKCGWTNIFTAPRRRSWRDVHIKDGVDAKAG